MSGASDLAHALRDAERRLAAAGVTSPRTDAELLAAHLLGVGRGEVARRAVLGERAPAGLDALVDQRAQRVPVQHLTGAATFRGLDLAVGPGVFVPRPETEVAAGLAVKEATRVAGTGRPPLVADLCTGSGAIGLSLASEVSCARVVAVELSPDAVAWARRNVARLELAGRVDVREGSAVGADTGVLADVAGTVDVVVANPPYIPPDMVPVDPEARDHDPDLALYGGGADGLEVPRGVVAAAVGLLRAGGLLVMEHADVQAPATRRLAAAPWWRYVSTVPDLAGRPRVLVARRTGEPA